MIGEQYVSFEVAKLLKEIGFNIPINTSYSEDGKSEYNMLPDNFNKFQWHGKLRKNLLKQTF